MFLHLKVLSYYNKSTAKAQLYQQTTNPETALCFGSTIHSFAGVTNLATLLLHLATTETNCFQ